MKITFGTFSWGYQHARMFVCTMCVCVTAQHMLPNTMHYSTACQTVGLVWMLKFGYCYFNSLMSAR